MKRNNVAVNELGFSCVENYTLSILKRHSIDYRCLFYKSYISSTDLLTDVINSNSINQYKYVGITRIHEIAYEELHLISLVNYDVKKISLLWQLLKTTSNNLYYLICVVPDYIKTKFGLTLAREDHYICYYFRNNCNNIFNDYPTFSTTISDEKMENIYNGNIISLEVLEKKQNNIYNDVKQMFAKEIKKYKYPLLTINFNDISLNQTTVFLSIYKKILLRLKLFFEYIDFDIPVLNVLLTKVDNLKTIIDINNFKGKETTNYKQLLLEIFLMDEKLYCHLIKQL